MRTFVFVEGRGVVPIAEADRKPIWRPTPRSLAIAPPLVMPPAERAQPVELDWQDARWRRRLHARLSQLGLERKAANHV
jgi:hypothetical protein